MGKKRSRGQLPLPMLQLTRLGALAPSRQNTQPWKFSVRENAIRVYPDFSRRLPVVDSADQSLYVSLGCVIENILVAAQHYGFYAEMSEVGSNEDGSVLISFTPLRPCPPAADLMSGMALRQCNRRPFRREPIWWRDLQTLSAASRIPGVGFGLVTEKKQIERVAELVRAGQREKKTGSSSMAELALWTRFSKSEAEAKRDGVLFTEMGFPPLPRPAGRLVLLMLMATNLQAYRSFSLTRSSSALIFFAPQNEDKVSWFNVGRCFQRVVLTAAALRIRYAHLQLPYCQPVNSAQLAQCLGCAPKRPLLVARLGYSDLAAHTLRRPLHRLLLKA